MLYIKVKFRKHSVSLSLGVKQLVKSHALPAALGIQPLGDRC